MMERLAFSSVVGIAVLGIAYYASLRTVVPHDLLLASYRCAANGPVATKPDDKYAGLQNLKSLHRTGTNSVTVVCANGAHFYDTVEWCDDCRKAESPPAPDPGSGKPTG